MKVQTSNLRRNLIYSAFAFVLLISAAFLFSNFLKKNPEFRENDLVSVSRNVFDKVENGQLNLQYKSNNPKELSDSMNKNLDFQVYIPDVKDAVLIGGICNEYKGEKIAHIIHRKGNMIIYTLQVNFDHVMNSNEKIILCDEFKENLRNGKNWFPCEKDKDRTAIVWTKGHVVCSTVSHLDAQEVTNTLNNYK